MKASCLLEPNEILAICRMIRRIEIVLGDKVLSTVRYDGTYHDMELPATYTRDSTVIQILQEQFEDDGND